MTIALAVSRSPTRVAPGLNVRADWLAIALFSLFASDNILLLQFLGLSAFLAVPLTFAVVIAIVKLTGMRGAAVPRIPIAVLGYAMLIALTVFLLGGEGRLFYANADWQIRDAILKDISSTPWPFAYDLHGEAAILRAPLGMYLLPSLGGSSGSEIALLLSNSIRLTLLISLAWLLFDSRKKRIFALCIFLVFSGWDIIGTLLFNNAGVPVSWDHLETWNFGFQYSSHITQAFWVPQHALAGWASALTFLLWRKGLAPVGWFAATISLVAIWSPLVVMGAVPFVLLAGVTSLLNEKYDWHDVALALLAFAASIPALLYLQVDAVNLGSEIRQAPASIYILLFAFEVAPFIILPLLDRTSTASERWTLWTILACLILMPFWKIGINSDFQMRASIMPLALLALIFAEWCIRAVQQRPQPKPTLAFAALAVLLGTVTPAFELRRALVNDPSPAPLCSLVGVWNKQSGLIAPYAAYLATARSFPGNLKQLPARVGHNDPADCWDGNWQTIAKPSVRDHWYMWN